MSKKQTTHDGTILNIKKHLQTLKLSTLERIIEDELDRALKEKRSLSETLESLLSREAHAVIERRIENRIKASRLPHRKLLADFDFTFNKSIDKSQVMELATLHFVERKQGLLLAGSSGTGKSHIAQALLLIGCLKLYRCRYTTASAMLNDLMASLADETLHKKLKQYTKPDILLIDEIGFDRLEQETTRNASLFFKVIEARYCKNATLMTTNIDFQALGEYLGDPVITTAVVDRMVHHAIIMNFDGPSYRIHESKYLNKTHKQKEKPIAPLPADQ